MNWPIGLIASGLAVLAVAINSVYQADAERKEVTVRAEEIGRSVTVLGRLEQPLHEMMTVRGVWVESSDARSKPDNPLRFRATHVNGQALAPGVEFHVYDVTIMERPGREIDPVRGEQWELRAYETWPLVDHPEGFWSERDAAPPAPAPHGATRLIGVLRQRAGG
jgi:hypothetical protein